jgi:hypothetical protein
MQPLELRVELTEIMIQELLWRVLSPAGIVLMPNFTAALEQQYAQVGAPPDGAQVSGISVTTLNDRIYAEITYTAGAAKADEVV